MRRVVVFAVALLAACRDSDTRARAHVDEVLAEMLARLPPPLSPSKLVVHVGEERLAIAVDRETGALRVDARRAAEIEPSIWLHELAHVRMRARSSGAVESPTLDAVEEGVADYFAAVVLQSPRIGGRRETRDLSAPPRIGAADWGALALPGSSDAAHRLGWQLAARLWSHDPSPVPEALGALLDCVIGPSPAAPGAVIAALRARCRATKAAPLMDPALERWLPPELLVR